MTDRLHVRANGSANAQVTDRVKAVLSTWLRDTGVTGAASDISESTVLFSHYCGGDYVAISSLDADAAGFREAQELAVEAHSGNRTVHDGCFWVAREWIAQLLEGRVTNGHESGVE